MVPPISTASCVFLLRIYIGFLFFSEGLKKLLGGFLTQPKLVPLLQSWLDSSTYAFYRPFLADTVMPHWQIFSILVTFGELTVGSLLVLGLLTRLAAVIALMLSLNFLFATGNSPFELNFNSLFIACELTILFAAAGRFLGVDYFLWRDTKMRGWFW